MPISEYMRQLRAKVGHDCLMMPAAGGIVINEKDEVLLQLRSDTKRWGIPGGALDPGEELADCVVREVYEETGITVIPERITSVLAGEDSLLTYPNGDQVAVVSITFRCRPVAGKPSVNDEESLEVRYFSYDEIPDNMHPRHRLMIDKAYENNSFAFFRYDSPLNLHELPQSNYIFDLRQKVGQGLIVTAGASGIVINDQNEILLQLRSDYQIWGLPGGAMELGEEPADGVVREAFEETGVKVEPIRIMACLAGQDHLVTYPNHDRVAVVAIVFICRPISGEPKVNDGESLDVRYFPLDDLPDNLGAKFRFRIEKAMENNPVTFFRYEG